MAKKTTAKRPVCIYEEFFEHTNAVLLLAAPLDPTTAAIESEFGATAVHRDVANSPVTHEGACVFAAQPSGGEWTVALEEPCYLFRGLLSAEGARRLSEASGRKTLLIVSEHNSGFVGYEMFEGGKSIEYFEWGTGDDHLRSTRGKSLTASQLSNSRFKPIKWISDVLSELDALVLPAATASMTETQCMFFSGDEDGSETWERVDAICVPPSKLPAENHMNVES